MQNEKELIVSIGKDLREEIYCYINLLEPVKVLENMCRRPVNIEHIVLCTAMIYRLYLFVVIVAIAAELK